VRVLLDEHLPVGFAAEIEGHEVATVRSEGWMGLGNGSLPEAAASAGFEVFVTNDGSIEHQQNLAKLGLGIVVLDAPSNKLSDLQARVNGARKPLALLGRARCCTLLDTDELPAGADLWVRFAHPSGGSAPGPLGRR
jgi:hypothetical protein